MTATTSCTVDGCPCMERDYDLGIDQSTTLEVTTDPWQYVAAFSGLANFVMLMTLIYLAIR